MENQKKVLVLGGTGAMGVYVVPELLRMGYKVDVFSLDEVKSDNPNLTYITGNARDEAAMEEIFSRGYDGIVDFMIYSSKLFAHRLPMLLGHTDHYIYLSSYRVYANEEHPITETSPRLLDVSKDEEMLATDTYALAKAREEDILSASEYKNWTAIRPAITFSKRRFQLVTLEADLILRRAALGKTVLLPKEAENVQATMTWAGDVAKMICRLLFNKAALCERFSVCTAEHNTWGTIAGYYKELVGMKIAWIPREDFLRLVDPEKPMRDPRWQLDYDRLYDRIMDNSKVLRVTGLKQSDFSTVKDALARELAALPKDVQWAKNADLSERMDEYIAQHNI